MWQDPIVEETHRTREKLAAEFDFDIKAIFADLRKRQASLGDRLRPQKKRAESTAEVDQARHIGPPPSTPSEAAPTLIRPWEAKRTDETRQVEEALEKAGFDQVDAYRYNSASIRVRVVDQRFEKLPTEKRDALVEPVLNQLPERTQADIMTLLTFAPSELQPTAKAPRQALLNLEFEEPSPSQL